MLALKVYTLKSCDTCKKALRWLDEHGVEHTNADIRADIVATSDLHRLIDELGWESVVNRRSTTWRGLDDTQKSDIDEDKAVDLLEAHPTLMKRPAFLTEEAVRVGFDDDVREWLLAQR